MQNIIRTSSNIGRVLLTASSSQSSHIGVVKIVNSLSIRETLVIRFGSTMATTTNNKKKFKVFVTKPMPAEAVAILEANNCELSINESVPLPREKLLASVKNVDALFCTLNEKIDREVIDTAGPSLKVVATCSVGFDHVDHRLCKERNIPVGYTPGVLTGWCRFLIYFNKTKNNNKHFMISRNLSLKMPQLSSRWACCSTRVDASPSRRWPPRTANGPSGFCCGCAAKASRAPLSASLASVASVNSLILHVKFESCSFFF